MSTCPFGGGGPSNDPKSVHYGDYLKLDQLLSAQVPESPNHGKMAHDEMLFIIIHQTYELWFKQILFEITSICEIFEEKPLHSSRLQTVVARFERVTEILKLLVDQIRIIETMTPLDFMDFRDYLTPASGFQSLQFKLLEAKLGMKNAQRSDMEKSFYQSRIRPEDQNKIETEEKLPSLFELVDQWLSRMPFTKSGRFNFWNDYEKAVETMLSHDEKIIKKNPSLDVSRKEIELKNLEATRLSFKNLLDAKLFEEVQQSGGVRMSQNAMQSAVFIHLFRDLPMLQAPYKILHLIPTLTNSSPPGGNATPSWLIDCSEQKSAQEDPPDTTTSRRLRKKTVFSSISSISQPSSFRSPKFQHCLNPF